MENLENLTVIILAKDRKNQLVSTIEYYKAIKINLLIVHQTHSPLNKKNLGNKITYVNSNEDFATRCLLAQRLIKTKYTILSTDDSRYLPQALKSMLTILQNHKSIRSIGAQSLGVFLRGPFLSTDISCQYNIGYSNLSSKLESRVLKHFKNAGNNVTYSSIYRMYHTEDFKKMLQLIYKSNNMSTPYIAEVISEIFSLNLGKIKYINELLYIKNWIIQPINDADWDRSLFFAEWWDDGLYRLERNKLWTNLGGFLGEDNLKIIFPHLLKNRRLEVQIKNQLNTTYKFFFLNITRKIIELVYTNFLVNLYILRLIKLKKFQIKYNSSELKYAINSLISTIGIFKFWILIKKFN